MSQIKAKFIADKSVVSDPLKLIQWDATGDIEYVPNDSGDWISPPTGALEGLDELASRIPLPDGNEFSYHSGDGTLRPLPIAGVSDYFFHNVASDVATYFQAKNPAPIGAIQTISNTGLGDGESILATFITQPGKPGTVFIQPGIVSSYITALKVGGTKTAKLFVRIYRTDSAGGSPLLLATSGMSPALTGLDVAYLLQGVIPVGVSAIDSDRRKIEIVVDVSGGGSSVDIDIKMADATASRLSMSAGEVDVTGKENTIKTIVGASSNFNLSYGVIYLTSGAIDAQLPVPESGKIITIKKTDSNNVTIVRNGSENIEGVAASFVLTSTRQSVILISDSVNWFII